VNSLLLALRALRREWRAGDLRIVLVALTVAVASLVSVTAFVDRSRQALLRQGSEFLAADLVVHSSFAPNPLWSEEANRRGLASAQTTNFRSVVVAPSQTALAEIKAVSSAYPLRGRLRIADDIVADDREAVGIPTPGSVWVEARLLTLLGIGVGDRVRLGSRGFFVSNVITYEPDRGGVVFSIAPRLLINSDDLMSTQLIQPGSLLHYHQLYAGAPGEIADFRRWLIDRVKPGTTVQDADSASPRFSDAFKRGGRFLGLATLVSMVLAAVSIITAVRHYADRHLDHVAIMRCFGASQQQIITIYALQLVTLGLLASAVGCVLGYAGQQVLAFLLSDVVGIALPAASLRPAAAGVVIGVTALTGFGLPTILRLKHVPPLRVFRRELGPPPPGLILLFGPTLIILVGLIFWMTQDAKLAALVAGGSAATVGVLAAAGYGLIRALAMTANHGAGASWRFGIANLRRRASSSTLQIVSLGLGVMAMLLLTTVRSELMEGWEDSLPPSTPNHFLINVQSNQVSEVAQFLRQQGLKPQVASPIVRARLLQINGSDVRRESYEDPLARRAVERAANLSWAAELQTDNRVVAGQWWRPGDRGSALISVEQDYAHALGLGLGDILRYQIADQEIDFYISSLREVTWDSFMPNFFLLVPPDLLSPQSASYITSIYVPRSENLTLRHLIEKFPNVTDIDVGAVLQQVRRLLDLISQAMEYVFVFTLAAGIVVLYAAIQTTLSERRKEIAVLRTLGATRRRISMGLVAEFAILGMLAGAIGALGASVTGYMLARFAFGVQYDFDPWMWAFGIVVSALIVAFAGVLGTRHLLQSRLWDALQQT